MTLPVAPPKRFPFCVVWSPIPFLTWIFPFIGHVGVCLSSGIILDFAGPYYVAMDTMSFGNPTKYWMLDPELATFPENESSMSGSATTSADWDKALQACTSLYQLKPYSLLSQNCHHFVIRFLNQVRYDHHNEWSVAKIATHMFLKGRFVGWKGLAKTWLPHICLVGAGSLLGGTTFFVCWLLAVILTAGTWAYVNVQAKSPQGPGVVGLA